ncbi:ferredoxin [Kitasatospora sp. GAS204A]|uniref:ferredoxin n=1 Tax=unclassified Kitasatospora TaxID=2633591 RepID=UPI0024738088|nr:ferredoxin [Kitasatospora sp. GAS204B]MDH6121827.1 ferredoxin [Kitasatospora sp. GAS204B]
MDVDVDIDRDACVGAGQCALTAPSLFDQDEDDGLVVLLRRPEAADRTKLREVVSMCPARALRIRES